MIVIQTASDVQHLSDEELLPFVREYMSRLAVNNGRPPKLQPCGVCGTPLTARQRRRPCIACGHRQKRISASQGASQRD